VCALSVLPTRERSLYVFFLFFLLLLLYNIPFFFQRKKALTFFFEFFLLSVFCALFALTFHFPVIDDDDDR
jgi:hypothetical protein